MTPTPGLSLLLGARRFPAISWLWPSMEAPPVMLNPTFVALRPTASFTIGNGMGWRLRRTFIVRVVSIYLDLLQISTVSRNAGLASFMLTEHTPDITFTTIIGVPRRFMGPMIEVSFRSSARSIMLTPVCAIFRAFAYRSEERRG